MNIDPRPPRCAKCGRLFRTLDEVGLCILCGGLFCTHHLTLRKGVSNCDGCEPRRQAMEETGGVADADEARVVRLLGHDVANTVGSGHHAAIEEAAARVRLFTGSASEFEQWVVDEVQQYFHDTFVDTAWPACPDHPNHPLSYVESRWRCPKTGRVVAQLGELTK